MQTREILKKWFSKGKYPTESQFAEWIDSFFHKNDKLPLSSVEGLDDAINSKAEKKVVESISELVNNMKSDTKDLLADISSNDDSVTCTTSGNSVDLSVNTAKLKVPQLISGEIKFFGVTGTDIDGVFPESGYIELMSIKTKEHNQFYTLFRVEIDGAASAEYSIQMKRFRKDASGNKLQTYTAANIRFICHRYVKVADGTSDDGAYFAKDDIVATLDSGIVHIYIKAEHMRSGYQQEIGGVLVEETGSYVGLEFGKVSYGDTNGGLIATSAVTGDLLTMTDAS